MKSNADSYDSELAQQSIGGSSLPASTGKFSLLSLYPGHQGGEDILLDEEQKTTQDLLDELTKWKKDPECRQGTGDWGRPAQELLTRHLNTVKNTQQRRTIENERFGIQLGDRFSEKDRECLVSMRDNGEEADDATQRQIVNDPDLVRELSRYSGEVQSTCRARIIFSAPQSAAISDAADRFTKMITTRDGPFGSDLSCYYDTKDIVNEMRARKLHDLYSIILGKPFCTYSHSCGQCHSLADHSYTADWTTTTTHAEPGRLWPAWGPERCEYDPARDSDPPCDAEGDYLDPVDPYLGASEYLVRSVRRSGGLSAQAKARLREHITRLIKSAKSESITDYSQDPVHYVWLAAIKERDEENSVQSVVDEDDYVVIPRIQY